MEPAPEFSRPVPLDQIAERERVIKIAANEGERAALARRFGILKLDRLEGTVRLRRSGIFYQLKADWQADVVQSCIVTLEPVAAHLAEEFTERYGPTDQGTELDLDPEVDAPEPIEGASSTSPRRLPRRCRSPSTLIPGNPGRRSRSRGQ